MSNQSIIRITREYSDLQKSSDLSLAVACRDVDVRHIRAIIIGPPDSPYEFGFFEFNLNFPREYPGKAPGVLALTTNSGRCRFNPNIYAGGKICLSILGTWRGERGEQWSSAQGLESILISIQSLMSPNPYENEPGYDKAKSDNDQKNIEAYKAKIRHETIRISVIQRLERYLGVQSDGSDAPRTERTVESWYSPEEKEEAERGSALDVDYEPFRDLCKRRFLWYYDSYLQSILQGKQKYKENTRFKSMPFEYGTNGMEGQFCYGALETRLRRVRALLETERDAWAEQGMIAQRLEQGVAANLERQFQQCVEAYKRDSSVTVDLERVNKNPFVWQVTYFGRPMTNLDGGLFPIRINFSPRFPDEQPRVKFETPLFHHRISESGVVCYFVHRLEDVKSHIDGIIDAIEEEEPPYDPRVMVNPEAYKLYWGSVDDRKLYNRRLRRSVQRSIEDP